MAELLLEELREEGKEVITKVEVEHLIQKWGKEQLIAFLQKS